MQANDDNIHSIGIELEALLEQNWALLTEDSKLVVLVPDSLDFLSTVWRIARFIAYDNHVAIDRENAQTREYRISSHSTQGLAFEVHIRALKPE
jgi:hypothetical protein